MDVRTDGAALTFIQRLQHRAPQQRLPALVRRNGQRGPAWRGQQIPASAPIGQPVGAINLVLVKQIRQTGTQLQQAIRFAGAQKTRHRLEAGYGQQVGQMLHQAPGECRLVHGRLRRHLLAPQHLPVGAPQKPCRQLDACGRAHAPAARLRHLEPLGHAVALNEDDLVFQWGQRPLLQPGKNRIGQRLGTVAVQSDQARRNGRGHR